MSYRLSDAFRLDGRVAMITGSANILGPEFAAALAEFGASLALVDIDRDGCERVAAETRAQHGVEVRPIIADVGDEAAVAAAVQEAVTCLGGLDILINAAATKSENYFNELVAYELSDWNSVMAVNLTGMFLCAKHVVPHLIDRGSGSIINVSSVYGVTGPDPRIYDGSKYLGTQINTPPIYSASKGGVVNLTRYLATTLAPHKIRANCISPGGVFSGQNETFVEQYSRRVPLGRMATREELRGATLFLASDAASYVTGQNLIVDGGLTAW